jgi:PAS domain S-box-containing protein
MAILERAVESLQVAGSSIMELLADESCCRRVIETANEGIWIIDEQLRIVYANDALAKMLGCHPQELVGRAIADFVFAEDRLEHERQMRERRSGRAAHYVRRWRARDGGGLPAWVSAVPITDGGRFAGSFAMISDISEQQRTEGALRASEQRYRSLFENAAQGFYVSAPEGQLLSANPALAAMYGYGSPEEMIAALAGLGQQTFVDPDDRLRMLALLAEQGQHPRFRSSAAAPRRLPLLGLADRSRPLRRAGRTKHDRGLCHRYQRAQAKRGGVARERKPACQHLGGGGGCPGGDHRAA